MDYLPLYNNTFLIRLYTIESNFISLSLIISETLEFLQILSIII